MIPTRRLVCSQHVCQNLDIQQDYEVKSSLQFIQLWAINLLLLQEWLFIVCKFSWMDLILNCVMMDMFDLFTEDSASSSTSYTMRSQLTFGSSSVSYESSTPYSDATKVFIHILPHVLKTISKKMKWWKHEQYFFISRVFLHRHYVSWYFRIRSYFINITYMIFSNDHAPLNTLFYIKQPTYHTPRLLINCSSSWDAGVVNKFYR